MRQYHDLVGKGFGAICNLCLGLCLLSGNGSRTIDHMGIHGEVPRCRHCGANHRIGKLLFCMSILGLCILTPLDRENRLAASNLMGVPISLAEICCWTRVSLQERRYPCWLRRSSFTMQMHYSWDVLCKSSKLGRRYAVWAVATARARSRPCRCYITLPVCQWDARCRWWQACSRILFGVWLAAGLLLREETVCWVFGLVRSKLTRGRRVQSR